MPSVSQTPQVMTRRQVVQLLALGAGAGVIAACGGVPQAQPAVTSTRAEAAGPAAAKPAAGQPKNGGTLRVGVPTDIVTLDGLLRGGAPYESTWLLYDRAVTHDDKLQ